MTDKTTTTIQDVKEQYFKTYNAECSDALAQELLKEFEESVSDYERASEDLKKSECILWGETLPKFMSVRKLMEDQDKSMAEYERKLNEMAPEVRWLMLNGYDNETDMKLINYLNDEGHEIIDILLGIPPYGEGANAALSSIIKLMEKYHDKLNTNDFMQSPYAESCEMWFIGIWGDGSRAIRTAVMINRACIKFLNGVPYNSDVKEDDCD